MFDTSKWMHGVAAAAFVAGISAASAQQTIAPASRDADGGPAAGRARKIHARHRGTVEVAGRRQLAPVPTHL